MSDSLSPADEARELQPWRDLDRDHDHDHATDETPHTFMVFRALRLTLQFHPHARATRQTVDLLFDDDFVPSLTDALVLRIRYDGSVGYSYDNLVTNAEQESADMCVIADAVNLFCPNRLLPWWQTCFTPTTFNSLPPLHHLLLLLLLLAIAVAIAIIAYIALDHPHLLLPPATPETEPTCVCPAGSHQSSPSPPSPPPVVHVRHAPIPLFDELVALLRHYIDLPTVITVSAQNVVERHYQVNPMQFTFNITDKTEPAAQTSVDIFMADLFHTTETLCRATSSWLIYSGDSDPREEDIRLLCRTTASSSNFFVVRDQWTTVTSMLTFSWADNPRLPISFLLRAFQEYDRVAAANASPADHGQSFHHDQHPPPHAFNNQTSYNLLWAVNAHFFTDLGSPAPFATVVYDMSKEIKLLGKVMADHMHSLDMLIDLLREHRIMEAAQNRGGQQSEQVRRRWFAGPTATPAESALDEFNDSYNRTIRLRNTQSTLIWMVGFTGRQMGGLCNELERIGNYTSALLATSDSGINRSSASSNSNSDDNDENWWRGLPWVTEAREAGGGPDAALVRTYWYLPAVGGTITTLTGLANWMTHETARTVGHWRWITAADRAWSLEVQRRGGM
ncbi:hypothetical protein LZ30DRAFT_784782 [Colletotrichum cereale]|nr:hypothetical protein LZ30DRAFT_784782 [Colletotrichum cereale]